VIDAQRVIAATLLRLPKMKKSILVTILWLLGLAFTFASLQIHAPFLFFLSRSGAIAMLIASLVVLSVFIWRKIWREFGGKWLILLWCLPSLSMLYAQGTFLWSRHNAATTAVGETHLLGQHFIVGYSSFGEVATLAEKGLIAGVYITGHNVAGRSVGDIKAEIAELQARRRAAGLSPLIVATDQEGGTVSHLSPPLIAQPGLSSFADLQPDLRKESAEQAGRAQGEQLASIGVNLNFAPVLDLKPPSGHTFDFNTLIDKRAISDDPEKTAEVGLAYVQGLMPSASAPR
jgi:beta-N-acetylhexosaminidase